MRATLSHCPGPCGTEAGPGWGPSLCVRTDQVSVVPPGGLAWLRGMEAAKANSAPLPTGLSSRGSLPVVRVAPSTGLSEQGPPLLFLLPPPRPTGTSTPISPVVQRSGVFIRQRADAISERPQVGRQEKPGQTAVGLGAGVKLSHPRWLQVWWVGCQAEGWGRPAPTLLQGSSEEAPSSSCSRRASQSVPSRLCDVGSFRSEKKRPGVE